MTGSGSGENSRGGGEGGRGGDVGAGVSGSFSASSCLYEDKTTQLPSYGSTEVFLIIIKYFLLSYFRTTFLRKYFRTFVLSKVLYFLRRPHNT